MSLDIFIVDFLFELIAYCLVEADGTIVFCHDAEFDLGPAMVTYLLFDVGEQLLADTFTLRVWVNRNPAKMEDCLVFIIWTCHSESHN